MAPQQGFEPRTSARNRRVFYRLNYQGVVAEMGFEPMITGLMGPLRTASPLLRTSGTYIRLQTGRNAQATRTRVELVLSAVTGQRLSHSTNESGSREHESNVPDVPVPNRAAHLEPAARRSESWAMIPAPPASKAGVTPRDLTLMIRIQGVAPCTSTFPTWRLTTGLDPDGDLGRNRTCIAAFAGLCLVRWATRPEWISRESNPDSCVADAPSSR